MQESFYSLLKEEMGLKSFFVVVMVVGILDTCWSTKRVANCSEETSVELSCHRSLYQNGLRLARERVSYSATILINQILVDLSFRTCEGFHSASV